MSLYGKVMCCGIGNCKVALSSQSLSQVSECLLFDLVEEWSLKFSNRNYNTKSTNLISGLLARLERRANNAKVAGSRPA